MIARSAAGWLLVLVAYAAFVLSSRQIATNPRGDSAVEGTVVLPATLQTLLYLGDRFLAANVESSRVLATGGDESGKRTDYFRRLHVEVSKLNPCHEDNYYLANALLAWAGAVEPALDVLRAAQVCRFWDEVPPFFLGYDLYFFRGDRPGAVAMLGEAANRATENRTGFQKMAIMIEAEGQRDATAARDFLSAQASSARDQKLRGMLAKRIVRLDGLIALRNAQATWERKQGRKLDNPVVLIESGVLKAFPQDPLGLGYEFRDGQFEMRELNIAGMSRVKK